MEQHLSLILGSLTLIGLIIGFGDKIFRRAKKEKGVEDRVKALEDSDCDIHRKLDKIMNNELVHIQADLTQIKVDVAEVATAIKYITKQ